MIGCVSSAPRSIVSRPGVTTPDDPALQSQDKTHRVRVRLLTPTFSTRTEELPAFDISVTNRGSTPLLFAASNVAVFSGTDPVRVYTAGELVDRIQKDAQQAAHEKSGESAEKILQSSGTRHDPSLAIAMIERDKMVDQSAAARATETEKFAALVKSIIPVSITPDGTGSGVIKLHAEDIAEAKPLRIVVTIAGESYEFIFEVGRSGS